MTRTSEQPTRLAYDERGSGTPIVLLPGLTFDRGSWAPVVAELGGRARTIAIDLPAHGESGGLPAPMDELAAQVHDLLTSLAVERAVVCGHSMMAGLAFFYGGTYPSLGIAMIDSGPEIQPFAQLAHRLEPALRGPGFDDAWQVFEDSLGLDQLPEAVRADVLPGHHVDQELILGYWEQMLRTEPAEFQAWVDGLLPKLTVPCLGVFGRRLTDGERSRLARLPDTELEEWVGDGHFVHLVDPARFAARLLRFVDHCAAMSQS